MPQRFVGVKVPACVYICIYRPFHIYLVDWNWDYWNSALDYTVMQSLECKNYPYRLISV